MSKIFPYAPMPALVPSGRVVTQDAVLVRIGTSLHEPAHTATAVVYCEGNLGAIDGKTANGLVRHSEMYTIVAVIDSENAGLDAGAVLDGEPNGIPVCKDLATVLARSARAPDAFIYGMAPATGMLSLRERALLPSASGLYTSEPGRYRGRFCSVHVRV